MDWIINNKEWIFSGIGVFILGLIVSSLRKKSGKNSMSQRAGKNSRQYQAGRDMNINE